MADSNAEVMLSEAKKLQKLGQNKDAENKYSDYIVFLKDTLEKCGNCEQRESIENALARAYNDRGFVKYLQVEFKAAMKDYTSSVDIVETEQAYYNRGLIKYRLNNFAEAIKDQEKALKINPDFKPARDCLHVSIVQKARVEAEINKNYNNT